MSNSAYEPIWSKEAEEAVLGAILLRPQVLDQIADFLDPGDFYRTAHIRTYQAMVDLYRRGEPVDLLSVRALLKERGQLEGVGGPGFLADLSNEVGFAINAEYYSRLVREKAVIRNLRDCNLEIASQCLAPVQDADEFLDAAEQKIFAIGQTRRQGMVGLKFRKRMIAPQLERK